MHLWHYGRVPDGLSCKQCCLQRVLWLWPTLLVGNALTIQQSLCLLQPTTNPPYIQQPPPTEGGTLANFFAGAQEEFQTILRCAMYCSHQLKSAVGTVLATMMTCFENGIGLLTKSA